MLDVTTISLATPHLQDLIVGPSQTSRPDSGSGVAYGHGYPVDDQLGFVGFANSERLATPSGSWSCVSSISKTFVQFQCAYVGGKMLTSCLTSPQNDIGGAQMALIGGVVIAAGTAIIFVVFVNILINPRLSAQAEDP